MKRLGVFVSALCLIAVGTGVVSSAPAGAGVPGKTAVFLANAFSYAGGHPFDGTFCVNGTIVGNPATGEVQGPLVLDSGAVTAQFWDSSQASCDANDPTSTFVGTFPDQGTVTLMAYWGDTGQALQLLDDPIDCVAVGSGRLTVRNGAGFGDPSKVDIYGDGPGGTGQLLVANIESGAQGTVDLPVGSYTNVKAVAAGAGAGAKTVVTIGTVEVAATSGVYAYLYGGNDGAVGSFLGNPVELNSCGAATTTTTAPATTTTAKAKPADAVATAPAFTG